MFPDTWLTDTVPISQEEVILTVRVSELMGGHGLMSLWLLFQSAIPEKKEAQSIAGGLRYQIQMLPLV